MIKARPGTSALCRILIESKGEIVSGGSLSRMLKLSRQSIWKNIKTLIEEGFQIESLPQKGYLLQDLPEYDLAPSYIGALLPASLSSRSEIYVFETLSSTQETAKQFGRQGRSEIVVVLSEEQTKGRGRRDRTWISPSGSGIFFSLFFRPCLFPGRLQLVNLAAGLAVKHAVENLHSVALDLKWPNDLLRENKKICGILSEASSESDFVRDCCTGIGINISPPAVLCNAEGKEILSKASFLTTLVGNIHRGRLIAEIISKFADFIDSLEADRGSSLLSRYREQCATLGREVIVTTDEGVSKGTAVGIGDNGELVVLTKNELVSFCAADVVHATPRMM